MINPRFAGLLLQALREFSAKGYRSEPVLQEWLLRLHVALQHELPNDTTTRQRMQQVLGSVFNRSLTSKKRGVTQRVPSVQRFTLARIAPELRGELDQRIFAGVELIRLNRDSAVQKTLQRFAGWVTSTPPESLKNAKIRDEAQRIAKPIRQLRFEQRRVEIDQGHKLNAAIAHVVARQEGAIAAIWHDRGQYDKGYEARPQHLTRSGKLFLIKDAWAIDQGLVRRGALPYTAEIEQPAELPYCSCWYEYVTSPRELPETVLTAKGRAWLRGVTA